MHRTVLLLLSVAGFTSAFAAPFPGVAGFNTPASAKDVVQNHGIAVFSAIKNKDKATLMKLFKTDSSDAKSVDQFIALFDKISVTFVSAIFEGAAAIDGTLQFTVGGKNQHSMKMHMVKSVDSPTGWYIDGIQGPPEKTRRFSMCWVGLFWCIIEVASKTALGEW